MWGLGFRVLLKIEMEGPSLLLFRECLQILKPIEYIGLGQIFLIDGSRSDNSNFYNKNCCFQIYVEASFNLFLGMGFKLNFWSNLEFF